MASCCVVWFVSCSGLHGFNRVCLHRQVWHVAVTVNSLQHAVMVAFILHYVLTDKLIVYEGADLLEACKST
jgi:hypothetical protein